MNSDSYERKKEEKPIHNIYNISSIKVLSTKRGVQQSFFCSPDLWQLFQDTVRGSRRFKSASDCLRDFMVRFIEENYQQATEKQRVEAKCFDCGQPADVKGVSQHGIMLLCTAHFQHRRSGLKSWTYLAQTPFNPNLSFAKALRKPIK